MDQFETASLTLPGRTYGSMDFKIWLHDDRGGIRLAPDSAKFLGKSYPFKGLGLKGEALETQKALSEVVEGVPAGNEAIVRGFMDKACTWMGGVVIDAGVSLVKSEAMAVVVWKEKNVKQGEEGHGSPVPEHPGLRFLQLRTKLVLPMIDKSLTERARQADQNAIAHVANYTLDEELAAPFLRRILDIPPSFPDRSVGPCHFCGESAFAMRTANVWTEDYSKFYAISLVQCEDDACEVAYLKYRKRLLEVLHPIVTGQKSIQIPLTCAGCLKKKPKEEMKRCARCKLRWYCSSECQKRHWPSHRFECKVSMEDRLQNVADQLENLELSSKQGTLHLGV